MNSRSEIPALVRPAILEGMLLVTSAAVAVVAALAGLRLQCTALVEFGIVSAAAAASAGMLIAQQTVKIYGFLADSRRLACWSTRWRTAVYLALAIYALVNGWLDIAMPRHDIDPISYPGLICAVIVVLIVTLVLETKYRLLQSLPSHTLLDSLSDDAFYLSLAIVTLAALAAHVFAPGWWLDTLTDMIFAVLIALRIRGMRKTSLAEI